MKDPKSFALDKGVPPAQVALVKNKPQLDADVVSTLNHAHEAEHSTGNEGWNPMAVGTVNLEWS